MPKGMIWSSLNPRISTQLTFTGHRPARRDARMPASTLSYPSGTRVMRAKRSGSTASMLTVTRRKPASLSGLRHVGQKVAVGGERDVEFVSIGGAQLGQLADEVDHALAQQRLSAGDADFLDSESDQHPRHAQIVGKRQIAVERALVPGAAVNTLVVAAVGDRDPKISDGAAEFVG